MHELHEEFGQCVTALGAVSTSLRLSVTSGETLTEADVLPLEIGVEQTLSSLRGLLQRMSQRPLEGQGLRSALADLITGWQIRMRDGPHILPDADGTTEGLPDSVYAPCVYRVVQECLSNIGRHAPSSREVSIHIRQTPRSLCVRVSNDFQRVHANLAVPSSGMGLKLIGERVRALHGSFFLRNARDRVYRSCGASLGRAMNADAPIRLLLAHDHAIVRAGYRHLPERQIRRLSPDVVITDLAVPGASGLEAIHRILAADASARVLVFSMHVSNVG